MFRDEMIDLALFILILGIVISVGLSLAVRTEKQAREDSKILAEDKNTRTLKGYGINEYGTFDGSLTRAQAVLMMQVQDYYMPDPKKVTVLSKNGTKTDIEIVSTYKENLATYGGNVFYCLKEYPSDMRFNIRYNVGNTADDISDDTYLISPVEN
jgi:hypothetical protein